MSPVGHPETLMLVRIRQKLWLQLQHEELQLAGMVPGQVGCGKAELPPSPNEDI